MSLLTQRYILKEKVALKENKMRSDYILRKSYDKLSSSKLALETNNSLNYKDLREEINNFNKTTNKIIEERKNSLELNKDTTSQSQAVINCREIHNPTPEAKIHSISNGKNVIVQEIKHLIPNYQLITNKNNAFAGLTSTLELSPHLKSS